MSRLQRWILYICIVICILLGDFYAGAHWGFKHHVAQAEKAEQVSKAADAAATVNAAKATTLDQQSKSQTVRVSKSEQAVAKARASLAELPSIPQTPEAKDEVIQRQAVLIAAQDQEIAALKLQDSLDRAAADQWKAAYDNEHKALLAQQLVSQAYHDAMKQASWKSGFKGALVGAALTYAASRVHH